MLEKRVIIIGGGPAGIFAALELLRLGQKNILILEKGVSTKKRTCPQKEKGVKCCHCDPCSIVCGFGGAGAFSDGKLTLTSDFGGVLEEYRTREDVQQLIDYIDKIYLSFGATPIVYGENKETIKKLKDKAARAELKLLPARIRHLGTEKCYEILCCMQEHLAKEVTIKTGVAVKEILVKEGIVKGVKTLSGETYPADYVICGPGREGSEWFYQETLRLGLKGTTNPVDIGIRVEVPEAVMSEISEAVYEAKLIYYSRLFGDRVRTFCVNPRGEVVIENNNGLITVNGHSYAEKKTDNTNFALLVSKSFTEPFKEPIAYGKYIASLANMLGGGVLVQRLGDLRLGRRSTKERIRRGLVKPSLDNATPGDLSLVLPYRHLASLLEMLEALDKIFPGVNSQHTLLYGVEVKFYSFRLSLSLDLETEVKNLFAVGDGAGITRGLAQASASGVMAARGVGRTRLRG